MSKKAIVFSLVYFFTSQSFSTNFEASAKEIYKDLLLQMPQMVEEQSNAFWQFANTFQAMLDYAVNKQDPQELDALAQLAYEIFKQKIVSGQEWWNDDYGWWHGFFNAVAENLPPSQKIIYQDAAVYCHQIMSHNAPFAWQRASEQLKKSQEPLFPGGCFNGDLIPRDQNGGFQGIQNTVTNALFLDSSLSRFLSAYKD